MASAGDSSISGAVSIGRYFVVVSLVPSTVFAAYLLLLSRTGAWGSGDVHFAKAFGSFDLKTLGGLGVLSVTFGLALHPLQFALIQALEGYWGWSWLGRRLAVAGIMRHRRRAHRLLGRYLDNGLDARPRPDVPPLARSAGATRLDVAQLWLSNEAARLYNAYPHEREDIMPTRLGNVLRRYETLAGKMYDIDAITAVPRLI